MAFGGGGHRIRKFFPLLREGAQELKMMGIGKWEVE